VNISKSQDPHYIRDFRWSGEVDMTKLSLSCIIKNKKMDSARSAKRDKRKKVEKAAEDWEKELNIKYHDVNPQWNYTIFPRSTSKQIKKDKK